MKFTAIFDCAGMLRKSAVVQSHVGIKCRLWCVFRYPLRYLSFFSFFFKFFALRPPHQPICLSNGCTECLRFFPFSAFLEPCSRYKTWGAIFWGLTFSTRLTFSTNPFYRKKRRNKSANIVRSKKTPPFFYPKPTDGENKTSFT